MTHLLALFPSHLAGSGNTIHVARYYSRCKKSLFFALILCKFRFDFCFVSALKSMKKCNIFPVSLENHCNILQVNILGTLKNTSLTPSGIDTTQHNLLACKILTQKNNGDKEKVQKMMQNFTCFSH